MKNMKSKIKASGELTKAFCLACNAMKELPHQCPDDTIIWTDKMARMRFSGI